jgi:hypothetical protein
MFQSLKDNLEELIATVLIVIIMVLIILMVVKNKEINELKSDVDSLNKELVISNQQKESCMKEMDYVNEKIMSIETDYNKSNKTYVEWKELPSKIKYKTIYKILGDSNEINECNKIHTIIRTISDTNASLL